MGRTNATTAHLELSELRCRPCSIRLSLRIRAATAHRCGCSMAVRVVVRQTDGPIPVQSMMRWGSPWEVHRRWRKMDNLRDITVHIGLPSQRA